MARKYSLHWALHPEKDVPWYEEQKKRRSEDAVARELDLNYALSVSGRVFSSFKEHRHATSKFIEFNPHLPVYRIWDFGKTNATLYAQVDQYSRKRILHERMLEQSNMSEQMRVAFKDSEELFPDAEFYDICDPAGSYEDQRGARTEVQSLEEVGIRPEYRRIQELPTIERKKRGLSMIIKDLQETPGGEEAFQLYSNGEAGCHFLKTAMLGGYRYKKDANGNVLDKIEERHPYEDVIDCLIYFYLEADTYIQVNDRSFEPSYDGGYNEYTGY